MLRSRVVPIAVAVLLVVAGIVVWQLVWAAPRTVSVTAGGTEIRFPEDAFGADARPTVSTAPADDEFLAVFGLTTGGSGPLVASVDGPAEPGEPLEVVLEADIGDLPAGAVPAVFVRDADSGLWLPLPTVVDDQDRLVGTADRLTDFAAATLTARSDEWQGARWLGFQVARDQAAQPSCSSIPPPWLLAGAVQPTTDPPLTICAESNIGGDLVVRARPDRPYPLVLSPPAAPAASRWEQAAPGLEALAGASSPLQVGDAVLAPAGVGTVLTWPAGSLPSGPVSVGVAPAEAGALLDTAVTGAAVAAGLLDDPDELFGDALSCIGGAADDALAAGELTRTVAEAAAECLDPIAETGQPVAERVISGVRTAVLLAAEEPQPEAAADEPSSEISLTLAEIVDPPPAGSTVLADALTGMAGVGPSGNVVSVVIDGRYADTSTTQWVGCEGVPAYAEYALGDQTRLTALLGARDYMPPDVVVAVRVLVDGETVAEYEVGHEAVPVDLALPPGDVLRIEAERIAGVCAPAPDAYLVFGNGALS